MLPRQGKGSVTMWKRFTENARQTFISAQTIAQAKGAELVEPEHLWLALCSRGCTQAHAILKRADALGEADHDRQFSEEAKLVLQTAYSEDAALGHEVIGTGHLLLGLVAHGLGGERLGAEYVRRCLAESGPEDGELPSDPPA